MASTFSPLLRIELIGTGDQSGTWGNTTNVNLGTLIEQSIAGSTTINVTAGNVTLTNFNGVTDEARCMAIRVTGTPGVSRNIIAPAHSKSYIVINGSDAAVVLKTSVSTGLTIPAGEIYLAVYDTTTLDFRLVGSAGSSTNTPNTIVRRDGSGNFAAGTITATLTGNVTGNVTGNLNGNLTATAPTANTAAVGTNTTQIATTAFVQSTLPSGVIVMWSGSIASIPSGWFLCNGSNGTPDLRDRFVVGAGSGYGVGATGGSANAIVVAHTHTGTTNTTGAHNHAYERPISPDGDSEQNGSYGTSLGTYGTSFAGDHSHVFTTDSTGSSGTNANLPPYYALAYIMKA